MKLEFPTGFDYVKQDFERAQVWEPRTTEYIKSHLKIGQTFLDIGAQVGYYTVLASQLGAKVIAFEPSISNRTRLVKNIQHNECKQVEVIPLALSNVNSDATLFNGKTPGEHSLLQNYHNGQGTEQVKTVRYDDMGLDVPDMIKMDIEGAERMALEGMSSVLTTNKPITLILEDWDNSVTDWLIDTHGFNLVTTERSAGNRILIKNAPSTYTEEPIRCHLIGTFNSPNTLADEGIGNAFGTKVINMAKILKMLGHYVIFYGIEGSTVKCDEFVPVSTPAILKQAYGDWDKTKVYRGDYGDFAYNHFRDNCVKEIQQRKLTGDFLLLCHGSYQQDIANAVQVPNTIEIGIGHRSSFAKFRIFESQYQLNWTYGNENKGDGNFYDCVIPGYFDPKDFEYKDQKDDYFLYLGRVIHKKGIGVARKVCEELGARLIVAGFGYSKDVNETDYKAFEDLLKSPNVEYVGFAGLEKRRELMAGAKALFLPTLYSEPFGYVVIEANMSGTPVITTPFGAFPEIVQDGVNGFKCWTHREFVEAANNIAVINSRDCRIWAMNYTLEKAAPLYKQYFTRILGLTGKGWYS